MISKSDIVSSLAGSTRGRLFYVTDVEGGYAMIADGRRHKLSRPKRKNLKHLRFVAEGEEKVAAGLCSGEVLDSELRRSLKEFSKTEEV